MLRRLAFLLLLIFGIITFVWFDKNQPEQVADVPSPSPAVLGMPPSEMPQIIAIEENKYNAYWYTPDIEDLILIPNYDEKITANEAIAQYGCEFVINAGFYDENRNALGLVVAGGDQLYDYRKNNLFNAIFSINKLLTPRISVNIPSDELVIAVQSGPQVFKQGQVVKVATSTQDKNARRSLVAVTGDNKAIFIHLTGTNNSYYGPTLAELPKLISKLNAQYNLDIADALNLDGGSASVFIRDNVRIKEISLPGAYFCER